MKETPNQRVERTGMIHGGDGRTSAPAAHDGRYVE